ncbi:hypothetical protein EDD85DRAFT_436907 [Armillaria nabsnona]|nr:hypothetical protein EDD85DRAFT_436907 [Armillaria nabsnona]
MAEVLGVVSSIVTLIEISYTFIEYLKDVKEAPKECNELFNELSDLTHCLSEVKPLTEKATDDDPWLATMQELSGPFARLEMLLDGLKNELELASSGMKRLLWKFKKESVEDALKKIERIKSLVIVAVQRDHVALSRAINETLAIVDAKVNSVLDSTNKIKQDVSRVDMNIVKISGQVAHAQKTQDDDMEMRVIAWLTDLNFKSVQAEKLSQRVGDTGRWFLESEQFQMWVDGSATSSCLWCSGGPGVGKTVMASIIIHHLQMLNQEKALVLSIFCDYRSAAAQTVANLLCSLLKQLVQDRGLSSPIASLYNHYYRLQTRPSLDALTKILSQELKLFDHVYIILDALDEFTDDNGGREELIETMKSLGDNTHLLVTSRDITTIGFLFEEDIWKDIRAADEDIKTYIMSKLSSGRLARHIKGRDDLRQEILAGVTEKADGMFLLAGLHMDLLAQTTNRKLLRDALSKLPDNMASAYDKTLERVNSQGMHDKDLAYRVFGWVAFSGRPLTVLELRYALAVEPGMTTLDPDNLYDDDLLESVCAGLVVMDWTYSTEFIQFQPEGPIIRFVHYTTQEYFMSRQDQLFPYIDETITSTCLTYMSDVEIPIISDFAPPDDSVFSDAHDIFGTMYAFMVAARHPFLAYSSIYWKYHAKGPAEFSMEHEIITFLDDARHRQIADAFREATLQAGVEPMVPSSLLFTVYHGLVHIMEALLDQGADPHEASPLVGAAGEGQLETVKLLLSRDDVDVNQADPKTGRTPLMEAARIGCEEMIHAILDSKHMNSLNSVDRNGESALFRAIYGNHEGVVRILLATPGINVTLSNRDGHSPLTIAVCYGPYLQTFGIMEMLLEREDVDPDARSPSKQWTTLFYAAEWGNADAIEMLLQTGSVDVNSRDCKGCTALMTAARLGATEAAKVLLEYPGIDVMARDNKGMTAYSHAYWRGRRRVDESEGVIALLDEYGGRPKADNYAPTYLTTAYLPNEQL